MTDNQLSNLFLEQSNDLIWIIDSNFCLKYANQAYQNVMKQVTGEEKKMDETIFIEDFGDGYIEKWKAYYERSLNGEHFEIEEHFYNPNTNQVEYSQITFKPLTDENGVIVNVACQSRDITFFIKSNTDAEKLLDASSDVICSIDEQGNFTKVSAACKELWGYEKHELIGKAYIDFVIEEDVEKTNLVAADIIDGQAMTTFENRYKRKDGGIAFNLWSAKWYSKTQTMFCVARDGTEKIKKEELLMESEQRFKALVQEGADMISIIDVEGRYIYTSPTTTGILGITPEDFQGRTVFDFIHPDDIERAAGYMQRISTENKVIVEPFRLRDGNNEWRWIETVLTNMLDNPAVNGIVANSRDITETKNIFNKIEANDQFNKTVIESSPDCLKILDNEGRLMYMNFNGLCQMEIDDFSEVKNKQWGLLWGPENEALVRESVDKALTGETVQFTAFCPTAKGTPKWWDVMVSPVIRAGEPIEKIISVSRDITEKKEEEHRLKLLESVITNTNDAVLITEAEPFDEPGPRILYVNEAFTNITGYTAEEVIGKSPRMLQGPNSDKAELARLSKALRNWETCEINTINYKKNGEEFWVNLSVSPVTDEKGWYTHFIAIEKDVTERKKLELSNNLTAKVSALFNIEPDLSGALYRLCEQVAVFGQFSFCEIWLTDVQESLLELKSVYKNEDAATIFYENSTLDTAFEKGQGLPGKIWENTQSIVWEHKGKNQELFLRSADAEKAGIKTIVGFPLTYHDKFIGVIQFGSLSTSKNIEWIITALEELGAFIGTEIARKKTEIELTKIFEFAPDIIAITGFDGYLKKVNPYTCKLLGYTESELILKPFSEHIHPEDLKNSMEELSKLSTGIPLYNLINRHITKSGDIRTISWNASPSLEDGLIFCIGKDITEEKKLKKLNKQANNLAKGGNWEYDLIENKLFWSNEVFLLHDLEPDTFVPNVETAIDFYKEEHKSYVTDEITKSLTLGVYLDYEAIIITKSKKEKWVRVIASPEFVEGKCVKFIGSFQDTTELREAESRLQSLSDNIPGVVFIYLIHPDGSDEFKYVSKGSEKIWGYSPEEVIENTGLVWNQVKAGGDFEAMKQSISDSIENKSQWYLRYRIVRADGKKRILQGLGTPEFLSNGSVQYNSVVLDITEEAKNEELLEQTSSIARIGSWEVDLINNSIFWSDITHEIHETPENFKPQLSEAIHFYREDFRELATETVNACMETGTPFDFEAIIVTNKNNELWVRSMGKAEMVDGKCVRIFGSFQDINQKKVAELRLQSLANNIPGTIFQYQLFPDGTDKLLHLSAGVEKLWGIDAEAGMKDIGLIWDQIIAGGDIINVQASIAESMTTLTNWHSHFRSKLPNGKMKWLEGLGTPRRLPDGSTIWDSIILDITDLKETEQLLDSASKLARVGSWELILQENEEHKMFWSSMTKNIVEIDEFFEPTLADGINLHKEPSRTLIAAAVDKAIETGEAFDLELELLTYKGNDIWVRCIGDAQFENGKVTRIFGSYQDINTRKLAELKQLKLVEEKSKILESIGDAFFAVGKNWVVTYWNQSAESVLGKKKEDIVGKNLWEEYADAIESDFYTKYHYAMETMETQSFEAFYKTTNQWIEVTAYPSEDGLSVYFKDITQRKKANEEVAKSEEKRKLIMNGALDAIITIDIYETITFWNPQAEIIFGWKAEEVMGKPLSEVIIPEPFRKYHVEGLKNYLKTGEGKALNVLLELSAIRRNREEFPIELTVLPIKQGAEEFFCAFIRDISQRKKAERELLNAFNEKTSILERITEAFISLDTNWCYTYMNKQAGEIFNRDPEKIIGKHIWTEFPEGLNQPFHLAYEKAMATQEYIYLEEHYEPYDSWFENHIYPSPDGISIFFRDVTERKRSEKKLKMANERFEKVTEATNDVIWDWDIENGKIFRSNAIDNFFGVETPKLLENKDFWNDSFHKEDIPQIKSSIQKALEDPDCKRWEEEYRILNNNNEIFFVIDRGLILRNKNGKAIRMVGAMTNITEQKKYEEKLIELNKSLNEQAAELKRSNEDLEQFAFITSHDLQEPLRMISSFMDQLKRKYADRLDEKGLQYIHFATDGAKRMKQIILDLLLYSRANKPTEQNELINLNEIVYEYTQLRRKVIAEKKAIITFDGLPSIETCRAPITQIFHCLLDNALKYVDENKPPSIEIDAIEKENVWQFAIKDNGIGIDQKFFSKIFIIFQRLQNRKENDGTGIGLAIAKRSIEFLGGEIWVESEIDKGSTFYFTIFKIK